MKKVSYSMPSENRFFAAYRRVLAQGGAYLKRHPLERNCPFKAERIFKLERLS